MPCYRPVQCFKPLAGGAVSFTEIGDSRSIQIRCGQCIGCRIDKRDMWAVRCYAESKCHDFNSFVTLTYDEDHYPLHGSLNYRHVQLFMKRVRRKLGPFRFFVAGEYGDELSRPHYHALLFGLDFADKYKCNSVYSRDNDVFRSATLEKLWPFGFSTIGSVTYESARYCAAYICKKRSASNSGDYYSRVDPSTGEIVWLTPEFAHMSLKPGIGAVWLEKYWKDVYVTGHKAVVINGSKHRAPSYFDKRMLEIDSLVYEEHRLSLELEAQKYALDNTPDRLAVREAVAIGKREFDKQRSL